MLGAPGTAGPCLGAIAHKVRPFSGIESWHVQRTDTLSNTKQKAGSQPTPSARLSFLASTIFSGRALCFFQTQAANSAAWAALGKNRAFRWPVFPDCDNPSRAREKESRASPEAAFPLQILPRWSSVKTNEAPYIKDRAMRVPWQARGPAAAYRFGSLRHA